MADEVALVLTDIEHSFGATRALRGVSLEVRAGEIHGLLGENGSGKSTLVKILTGYYEPDRGGCRMWGEEVQFPIRDPRERGIAVIHQDLGLAEGMTVLENLGVGRRYGARALAPVRWRAQRTVAKRVLAELGVEINVDREVARLPPAQRALVAIARGLVELEGSGSRHLFILDEPTAHLGGSDADQVVEIMQTIARRGAAVIFISHHISEMIAAVDRITVLRDGAVAGTVGSGEVGSDQLVTMMLGRPLEAFFPSAPPSGSAETLISTDQVSGATVRDLSLTVASGEIVGVTGLTGMGHEEIPYLLAGAHPARGGRVVLPDGSELTKGPRQAARQGVVLIPGNRARDGAWLEVSASENISLPVLGNYFRRGLLRQRAELRDARAIMMDYDVRPPDPNRPLRQLSGGNQQKVVLGKWLRQAPRVVLMDEPTQGVDVGAKQEILELVRATAGNGASVLMATSDEEQLANVCTRVEVMSRGRVVASLSGSELTPERIVECCYSA